jgi:rhodanese-related sulfurtransferase
VENREINSVPRITCQELKHLIDSGERVVIIDTRESRAYTEQHITGAVNIFYNPLGDPMDREIRLSALPTDALLTLYCD